MLTWLRNLFSNRINPESWRRTITDTVNPGSALKTVKKYKRKVQEKLSELRDQKERLKEIDKRLEEGGHPGNFSEVILDVWAVNWLTPVGVIAHISIETLLLRSWTELSWVPALLVAIAATIGLTALVWAMAVLASPNERPAQGLRWMSATAVTTFAIFWITAAFWLIVRFVTVSEVLANVAPWSVATAVVVLPVAVGCGEAIRTITNRPRDVEAKLRRVEKRIGKLEDLQVWLNEKEDELNETRRRQNNGRHENGQRSQSSIISSISALLIGVALMGLGEASGQPVCALFADRSASVDSVYMEDAVDALRVEEFVRKSGCRTLAAGTFAAAGAWEPREHYTIPAPPSTSECEDVSTDSQGIESWLRRVNESYKEKENQEAVAQCKKGANARRKKYARRVRALTDSVRRSITESLFDSSATQTHLVRFLRHLDVREFDEAVVITDGIDTSSQEPTDLNLKGLRVHLFVVPAYEKHGGIDGTRAAMKNWRGVDSVYVHPSTALGSPDISDRLFGK